MAIHTITQGDTAGRFPGSISHSGDNTPLANVDRVDLHLRHRSTGAVVTAAATIDDLPTLAVSVDVGDISGTPGDYDPEWQVTYTDATVATFPVADTLRVRAEIA